MLIRDDQISVLAVAAELVTEDNLHRLREISRAPARVVLTRRRAVALGLASRAELSGALTISVSTDMPAAVIRNLADPGASLGAEPPGFGPAPLVAKGGARAAAPERELREPLVVPQREARQRHVDAPGRRVTRLRASPQWSTS